MFEVEGKIASLAKVESNKMEIGCLLPNTPTYELLTIRHTVVDEFQGQGKKRQICISCSNKDNYHAIVNLIYK